MTYLRLTFMAAMLACVSACSGGASDEDESGGASPVALVSLAPATQGSIARTLELYGEVERSGANQSVLAVPVEATVASIDVPQGGAVRAGEVVARLRPSPVTSAQMAAAQAQARSGAEALARAQRLRVDGLASDADVETARAAAAAASAQAAALARQTAGLALRAPHSGYVVSLGASPGDLLQPGAAVATLSNGGPPVARFGIAPAMAGRLHPGMAVQVSGAGGGDANGAVIGSVSPVADPQTRLASVVVRLPSGQGFAPGQALTASVPIAASEAAVTVPYAALLDDGGQPFVYVVSKGVAHRHDVVTGASDGRRIAILKGVATGDQVVTAGGTGVEDGMKVRIR